MWEPPSFIPSISDLVRETEREVSGLKDQKRRLAVSIHRHMMMAFFQRDYRKQNLIVLGPTGGGKTWMIRKMLEASGLPHVELNMTQFSEVGFAGLDLSSFPIGFYQPPWLLPGEKRNMITPLAERWGIVVLDEWDKLAVTPNLAQRQVGRALQAELLRISEGDTVYARARDSEMGTAFKTHLLLFIAVGAFENLSSFVDKNEPNSYQKAEGYHLNRYGFMEELIGRFSTIISLPPLNETHIYEIIQKHIWPNWVQQAIDSGFDLVAEEDALKLIANIAVTKKVGARGVEPLLEQALWRAWSQVQPGQQVFLGVGDVVTGAQVRDAVTIEDR
jgi:ATP-dependent Clp protease ATP-binding subunit ClpX